MKLQRVKQTVRQEGACAKERMNAGKNGQQKLSLTENKSCGLSVRPEKVYTHISYMNYLAINGVTECRTFILFRVLLCTAASCFHPALM